MGSSDEVRRLLDEHGVAWWPSDDTCCEDIITNWQVGPFKWTAIEGEKDLWLNAGIAGHEPLTPEQAIAATVGNVCYGIEFADWCEFPPEVMVGETVFDGEGNAIGWIVAATADAGTCKDVCASVSEFTCSECGFNCDLTSWISLFDGDDGKHRHHHHGTPKFCPNCGRKVVTE